ncbi:MAG: carbon-nitrogen hydrolase family protein [Verrucomicrobiales bacterium]|nr:carbon-nitrogen hydrolase family protein [Verrucomicrobiales bacterium]MCP5557074.1 carbon-nitrogen hydrolase family protein [Verrucomicrobiaceae bacterium]
MKIIHCQFESWCGELDHNLERFEDGLKKADAERASIVTFPECFLTGYPDTAELARAVAFSSDSAQMVRVLDITSRYDALAIVGYNEQRGDDLYNTAAVVHRGHLLGQYSKCAAYMKFHKHGRDFPVFEHQGVTFGVLICADGGYIEPARILALKGARIIFAPHFNYIREDGVLQHFNKVRADHTARAIENNGYFVRANNVVIDHTKSGMSRGKGVGYGDSYVVDPGGQIIAQSQRHVEDILTAEINPTQPPDTSWGVGKSAWSWREFSPFVDELVK